MSNQDHSDNHAISTITSITMATPFFACYLLTPVLAPQRLRCTYVGFTVAPTRRIRQHNGEIRNGAKRTSKHRPWYTTPQQQCSAMYLY